MRDRTRSGPRSAAHPSSVSRRVRLARLVSSPRSSAAAEHAEVRLRCALRRQLYDAFERGEGWQSAWSAAWLQASECLPQLGHAAPGLSVREEDYRGLLALDWRRWQGD